MDRRSFLRGLAGAAAGLVAAPVLALIGRPKPEPYPSYPVPKPPMSMDQINQHLLQADLPEIVCVPVSEHLVFSNGELNSWHYVYPDGRVVPIRQSEWAR